MTDFNSLSDCRRLALPVGAPQQEGFDMTAKSRRATLDEMAGRLEKTLSSIGHLADAIFKLGEAAPASPAGNAVSRLAWEIDNRADAFVHGLRQVQTMPWSGAGDLRPYPRPESVLEIANGMDDDLSAIRDFACALGVLSKAPTINGQPLGCLVGEIERLHAAAEQDFALFFGALHGRTARAA
jgi:hypothetical protein